MIMNASLAFWPLRCALCCHLCSLCSDVTSVGIRSLSAIKALTRNNGAAMQHTAYY